MHRWPIASVIMLQVAQLNDTPVFLSLPSLITTLMYCIMGNFRTHLIMVQFRTPLICTKTSTVLKFVSTELCDTVIHVRCPQSFMQKWLYENKYCTKGLFLALYENFHVRKFVVIQYPVAFLLFSASFIYIFLYWSLSWCVCVPLKPRPGGRLSHTSLATTCCTWCIEPMVCGEVAGPSHRIWDQWNCVKKIK